MKIVLTVVIGFIALRLLGRIMHALFFDIPDKIGSTRRKRAQEQHYAASVAANERLQRQQDREAEREAEQYLNAYRRSLLTRELAEMIRSGYAAHTASYTYSATMDMQTLRAGSWVTLSELGYTQFENKFQMYACAKAIMEILGPDYDMQATLFDYDLSPRVTFSRKNKKELKNHF